MIDQEWNIGKMTLLELVGREILDDLAVNRRAVIEITIAIERGNAFGNVAFTVSLLSGIPEIIFGESSETREVAASRSLEKFLILIFENRVVVIWLPPWILYTISATQFLAKYVSMHHLPAMTALNGGLGAPP